MLLSAPEAEAVGLWTELGLGAEKGSLLQKCNSYKVIICGVCRKHIKFYV